MITVLSKHELNLLSQIECSFILNLNPWIFCLEIKFKFIINGYKRPFKSKQMTVHVTLEHQHFQRQPAALFVLKSVMRCANKKPELIGYTNT